LRQTAPYLTAKNAGVSIETLTRAYDHTQSADYIMELTKSDYTGFDYRTS